MLSRKSRRIHLQSAQPAGRRLSLFPIVALFVDFFKLCLLGSRTMLYKDKHLHPQRLCGNISQ